MKKASKRNWIVASLLSITLTFGFLFGLQPTREVKVTHAVEYPNALSSEIKIELSNVDGKPFTTFENGRYLHINPAYKTVSTNDNSLGADMADVEKEYQAFLRQLGEGLTVKHKTFGDGVIESVDQDKVTIVFNCGQKRFHVRTLFKNRLLQF